MAELIPHVVFITPGFPANEMDTSTLSPFYVFAKKLVQQNITLSVVSLEYPFPKQCYWWYGAQVFSCGGHNHPWPLKLFTVKQAYNFFSGIHKKNPVHIIHSFWWQDTAVLGNYLSHKFSIPHLTTFMGQDVLPGNKYSKYFSVKSKVNIVQSDYQASFYERTFGRKPDRVIPFGIDESDFINLNSSEAKIDVIGVGGLNTTKDYKKFVKVIKKVPGKIPAINCYIVGDGEQRRKLEKEVEELGLSGNVKFTGNLPREEALKLMKQSKIFLHTSRFEGFGYVFAEALSLGLQIVSHPVGFADYSNALIAYTVEDLAEHVINILSEKSAPTRYSVPQVQQTVNAYFELYKELIYANKKGALNAVRL